MKTSELIKKIEALGIGLSVEFPNKIAVLFADNKQTPICEVDDNIISTYKDRFAINSPISNAIELMFEYAKTPLEEREEEKKYRLKVNCNDFQCLNLNSYSNDYCISNTKETKQYKTQFTQKEIDAMPFDTNFFIKEEVK